MALALYFHPFSSFCQKVLIALYENDTPSSRTSSISATRPRAPAFQRSGRSASFPSCAIRAGSHAARVEHHHRVPGAALPGPAKLVPKDPELGRQVRLWDRFFDLHVDVTDAEVVTRCVRPGRATRSAWSRRRRSFARPTPDRRAGCGQSWAVGDAFSMADCAAAPSLYYANLALRSGRGRSRALPGASARRARPSRGPSRKPGRTATYFPLAPRAGALGDAHGVLDSGDGVARHCGHGGRRLPPGGASSRRRQPRPRRASGTNPP